MTTTGRTGFKIIQSNLQHSSGASAVLIHRFASELLDIALIQEPWVNKGIKGLNHNSAKLICERSVSNPRAAILVRKSLKFLPLYNHTSRDLASVLLTVIIDGVSRDIVVASAYFPGDDEHPPPPRAVRNLISFCTQQELEYIIGCDANAHHSSWGSTDINRRGEHLYDYLLDIDAIVLNEGDVPTYLFNGREEVLDITVCSPDSVNLFLNWHVCLEPSLSDHRHIRVDLLGSTDTREVRRNPRKTDWGLFADVAFCNSRDLPTEYNSLLELELGADYFNDIIKNAYDLSTKESPPPKEGDRPWWTKEIEGQRKDVRRLWNRAKKTGCYIEHRHALTRLNDMIKKSKRNAWQRFCSNIQATPQTARIARALNKKDTNGIGFLRKDDGNYTSSRKETINLLLSTHFPESTPFVEDTKTYFCSLPFPSLTYRREIIEEVVTEKKVSWAINSFQPFKSPGGDGILPIMLQKCLPQLVKHITLLLRSSLQMTFIPSSWRKVNVVFIPKPGKDPDLPKSYRPISLSSFLLKTLERLVDVHIRAHLEIHSPLHQLQFAYMKGKSTESAIHCLTTNVESALSQGDVALAAFLDIQGAFDNTSFQSIDQALTDKNVDPLIREWILAMLKDRQIRTSINDCHSTVRAARGCPQGGVLSPLLWSIVIDDLLNLLNGQKFFTIGYADDIAIIIRGKSKFLPSISEVMRGALLLTMAWCTSHQLSVNPAKTTLILFHRFRTIEFPPISIGGAELNNVEQTTYLGIIIDRQLSWTPHILSAISKARRALWSCRSAVGKSWGLAPNLMKFIYTAMARPIVTYGCIVWWHALDTQVMINRCSKLQRSACLLITGCIRSCPTASMQRIIGLVPLHLHILQTAANCAIRLGGQGGFCYSPQSEHSKIATLIPEWDLITSNTDVMIPKLDFDIRFEVSFPERSTYTSPYFSSAGDTSDWYTDGSKTDAGSGSGIYNCHTQIAVALGNSASVFQAELYAITVCARHILNADNFGEKINIFSDSQAAIRALANPACSSMTVRECKQALNNLGERTTVHIAWIPGHADLHGNEEADRLANIGSASLPSHEHPIPKLGSFYSNATINRWILSLEEDLWNNLSGHRLSKALICQSVPKETSRWSRASLRLYAGYLTGHHPTRKYMSRIGRRSSSRCRLCADPEETTEHLLLNCIGLERIRYHTFGSSRMSYQDLRSARARDVLLFIRKVERLLPPI